ncbi:trypsin-like serine protease [Motilimonas cestriensis]|uniref:trypsin-like serine protease n=1 Tax=Motilimonas cestriensis TaxID=2742685 RepID=UPI001E601E67|nr:trypsin-like serine protease [Motilimonas cestriensis]
MATLVTALFAPIQVMAAEAVDQVVTPNIVGGGNANQGEWGFYTQLVSSQGNRSYCGASYLGNAYVLTAAHCVVGDSPSQVAVKVGGYHYGAADGQRANVSQIFIHPQYNSATLANDIAILKLDRQLPSAQTVQIAQGTLSQYVREGDLLTVAGLGRTQEGGLSPSVLQEVDVPLVSDAVCRQAGGSYQNVGSVAFCAGYSQGGKDSCQGDSGGPIVVNQGGVVTQLGIVSWGIGCARPGKYGVYSDIAALRPWVDGIIGNGQADLVAVGYIANQSLTAFNLGETKSHSFKLSNTGNVEFTIDSLNVSKSGVATTPVITRDNCSANTLQPNANCTVAVEFGGQTLGSAEVSLNFGIDKNSTAYQANVTAVVKDATTPTPPPTDNCSEQWKPGSVYQAKETVIWAGKQWQAKWWTQGDNPSEAGPWGVWQEIGTANCDTSPTPEPTPAPTVAPTLEPTPLPTVTPTIAPTQPPSDLPKYVAGSSYGPGDKVLNHGVAYQCKGWPFGLWCSGSAYEPGKGSAWQNAWVKL